jgi:hypothetical protein
VWTEERGPEEQVKPGGEPLAIHVSGVYALTGEGELLGLFLWPCLRTVGSTHLRFVTTRDCGLGKSF